MVLLLTSVFLFNSSHTSSLGITDDMKIGDKRAIESDRSVVEFLNIAGGVLSPMCPFSSYSKLTNYGCFCGLTLDWPPKSNKTMDSFDEICFEHDWCYTRAEKACSSWPALMVTFDYDFKEEMVKASENSAEYNRVTAYCKEQSGSWFGQTADCKAKVCQCDVEFANSVRQLVEGPVADGGEFNCPAENPGCNSGEL